MAAVQRAILQQAADRAAVSGQVLHAVTAFSRVCLALATAMMASLSQAESINPVREPKPVEATTPGVNFAGEYRDGLNIRRRYCVVPANTTDDQLIKLATQLHVSKKMPGSGF